MGEEPLSLIEYCALRAYTGPLYVKYNNVLRAPTSVFCQNKLKEMGMGKNRFATTIHVMSAAIVKLGKLTKATTVYRAPGRALAPSFWQQARKGLAGIVETGCLSTSTDKAVAKQYAQSSSAKLLFELQLGYVARGADLGQWGLSQYPSESEILMPPCTALQIVENRIEQDVVVVVLRPTIRKPEAQ